MFTVKYYYDGKWHSRDLWSDDTGVTYTYLIDKLVPFSKWKITTIATADDYVNIYVSDDD